MKNKICSALAVLALAIAMIRGAAETGGSEETSIYAAGQNGAITTQEVEQAAAFYRFAGMTDEEAWQQAVLAMEEREAMYQQAVAAGYTVTDEEIWAYLEELKTVIEQADNREDAAAVIEQFDSEEEYWEYEFEVYQKNLPIQKYVAALERSFWESAAYSAEGTDAEEQWQAYFEQLKKEAVEREQFQVVAK